MNWHYVENIKVATRASISSSLFFVCVHVVAFIPGTGINPGYKSLKTHVYHFLKTHLKLVTNEIFLIYYTFCPTTQYA